MLRATGHARMVISSRATIFLFSAAPCQALPDIVWAWPTAAKRQSRALSDFVRPFHSGRMRFKIVGGCARRTIPRDAAANLPSHRVGRGRMGRKVRQVRLARRCFSLALRPL